MRNQSSECTNITKLKYTARLTRECNQLFSLILHPKLDSNWILTLSSMDFDRSVSSLLLFCCASFSSISTNNYSLTLFYFVIFTKYYYVQLFVFCFWMAPIYFSSLYLIFFEHIYYFAATLLDENNGKLQCSKYSFQ